MESSKDERKFSTKIENNHEKIELNVLASLPDVYEKHKNNKDTNISNLSRNTEVEDNIYNDSEASNCSSGEFSNKCSSNSEKYRVVDKSIEECKLNNIKDEEKKPFVDKNSKVKKKTFVVKKKIKFPTIKFKKKKNIKKNKNLTCNTEAEDNICNDSEASNFSSGQFTNKCSSKSGKCRVVDKYIEECNRNKIKIEEKSFREENSEVKKNSVYTNIFKKRKKQREETTCINQNNSTSGTSAIMITGKSKNSSQTQQKCSNEGTHSHPDNEKQKRSNKVDQNSKIRMGNESLSPIKNEGETDKEIENSKKNTVSVKESEEQFSDNHKPNENFIIKTLEDFITYFNLSSRLEELETSLEGVRRNKKSKENHKACFQRIDKEIRSLSLESHPDKTKTREVQGFQTALNATRTALQILNSAFMDDISNEHKFEFYMKLPLDTLCNEDEVDRYINEIIFKIGLPSRIKQENIISQIRDFLIQSRRCVDSYFTNLNYFKEHRNLSLFYLKCCITGFKKFCAEINSKKQACKSEENGKNMYLPLQKMEEDSKKMLNLLMLLEQTAEESLQGNYRFFNPEGYIDTYFVLPFVSYINVILMCSAMLRETSYLDRFNLTYYYKIYSDFIRADLSDMKYLHYLASYYNGNTYYETKIRPLMYNVKINKENVKAVFDNLLIAIKNRLEAKFKVEDYNVVNPIDRLITYYDKHLNIVSDFEKTSQKLSKNIDDFRNRIEELDEKLGEFQKNMEEDEKQKKKAKECVSSARILAEKISSRAQSNYKE